MRTRAITERFCSGDSLRRGAISNVWTFTFTFCMASSSRPSGLANTHRDRNAPARGTLRMDNDNDDDDDDATFHRYSYLLVHPYGRSLLVALRHRSHLRPATCLLQTQRPVVWSQSSRTDPYTLQLHATTHAIRPTSHVLMPVSCLKHPRLTRWVQLRFDFDSTAVRRAFDGLSKVIEVTVT